MLKKIPVTQLRLGMHIHRLEGSWMSHPFWKTRFSLDDPADLRSIRASGVPACWIDPALGLDVAAPEPDAPAPRRDRVAAVPTRLPVALPPPVLKPTHEPSAASRSFDEELTQAAAICRRGREAVQSMLAEARLGQPVDAEACRPLVEEISASVMRNPGALVSLARLKTKDDYSYMHSMAVCALMVSLGRQLGLDDAACRNAGLAGLMHDLGKAVLPLEVLNKPGKLTSEEFALVRLHPERGHQMLVEARGVDEQVLEVCLHHHERIDGGGYPHGLEADAISTVVRMGALCDVYDAVTSNRPYKAGWDPAESIARMASWTGHFDPQLFQAFVRSLGIYPTGSLVRLESARLAVVVEQNAQQLAAPVVKVFFSTLTQMHLPPRRLDLSRAGCSDRIVGRESLAQWGFAALDELWLDPEIRRRAHAARA